MIEWKNDKQLLQMHKKLKKELLKKENLLEKRIAILSGSTTDYVVKILEIMLLDVGIKPIFFQGNYGCYYEDGAFFNEELKGFSPEIVYIHTTNKNIDLYPIASDSLEEVDRKLDVLEQKYKQIWRNLEQEYQCIIIQNNFEYLPYRAMGNADGYFAVGKNNFIRAANDKMHQYARMHQGLYINDINFQSAQVGLDTWCDWDLWYLYKYAISYEAIPCLCHNIASIMKSLLGKNKKSLVLDLDNTLWGGIVGDDGVEGILLGDEEPQGRAFADFQEYIKSLQAMGIVLNIASKNEEENALAALKDKKSILSVEDFFVIKANWKAKPENIREIISEINLLEESMVFVDDNPMERDLVKSQLSKITVVEASKPKEFRQKLDEYNYFEITSLSREDKLRNEFYQRDKEREQWKTKLVDYDDYLRSLEMTSSIEGIHKANIDRITQLINKTNQFNFTTKRYTKEEVLSVQENEDYIVLNADLCDKFGENGLVSILFGECIDETLEIQLFVMSCRVFKRQLEYAMMDTLILKCIQLGIKKIRGIYIPSSKNGIVKDFYENFGFEKETEEENKFTWVYDIPSNYVTMNKVIEVKYNDKRSDI